MMQNKARGRSKSEEKRSQIVDAAGDLFMEQGYESVSMEGIAKLAGVSKQTLYSHFGSKEQLFSAAIQCKCEEYPLADTLDNESSSCRESLEHYCRHLIELLLSPEAIQVYKVCIAEADRSDVGQLFWEAGPAKVREQLCDFFARNTAAGNLNIDDIDMACSQLISMLHGQAQTRILLSMTDCSDLDKREVQRYSQRCVDMFIAFYGA